MLQYILNESDRYGIAELVQMAIEGGCAWISLDLPELDDTQLREAVAGEVMEMCRQAGVFLTVNDRPDTATQLGLHGVIFSRQYMATHDGATPASLRESLGPEAVIGIETADASIAPVLQAADIDFAMVPASFDADARARFIRTFRAGGIQVPVVARGEFDVADVPAVMAQGFNGIAIGSAITDADDPVAAVGSYLDILTQAPGA